MSKGEGDLPYVVKETGSYIYRVQAGLVDNASNSPIGDEESLQNVHSGLTRHILLTSQLLLTLPTSIS